MYLVTTPQWFKWLYPSLTWRVRTKQKELYLTFDDGPHEEATPFVLDCLKAYVAKATFFCLGKNVQSYPEIFHRIIDEGHSIGNHTHNHVNGWKTSTETYIEDVCEARKHIDSKLFRPPYGRITRFQSKVLIEKMNMKVVMWDVLSGDFDLALSPEGCLKNVARNAIAGSIVVFHDSSKAWPKLKHALPGVLQKFSNDGFAFKRLEE